MGYSYGYNPRSNRYDLLCCDGCGNTSADGAKGVRKRTCPHKVLGDSLRSAKRYSIPYCYPAALCSSCYAKHRDTLHADCAAGAAASTAEADAIEAGLDAGRYHVIAAYGEWHPDCPPGKTLATFKGRDGELTVPVEDYDPNAKPWLDCYR